MLSKFKDNLEHKVKESLESKFRKSLEPLSADQVTEKLGNWCEQMGNTMTDKNKGSIKTFFSAAALAYKEHCNILQSVAAKKNGVELKGKDFEAVLEAIADAAEARDSKSAEKVRAYVHLVAQAKKDGNEKGYNKTKNPLKAWMIGVKSFKKFG